MEIAILGGGVAGVSSAIALKQKGFDVRVYEQRGSASNIGAGIVIWPNAVANHYSINGNGKGLFFKVEIA